MNKKLLVVSGHFLSLALAVASALLTPAEARALESGQTLRIGRGAFSIMPKNSSLDAGVRAEMWTDAQTNSQRWVVQSAGSTACYLVNAYTGKYLACTAGVTAGSGITVQERASAGSRGRWELMPVEGKDGQYIIYANTTRRYALSTQAAPADGSTLLLVDAGKADSSQIMWTVEECDARENALTPAVRDDMMEKWKEHYYHKAGTGYVIGNGGWWGDAEMFEVVLDALETTGDKRYATMFENLYTNFLARNKGNWISGNGYNEYNDDVAWMCIACVRAYLLTGVTKYLSTAKVNFDGMYNRAAKYDNGTLRWRQSSEGTTSCINGPAAVCACYLGLALGKEDYFEKAARIYAGERGMLYNINAQGVFNGQVYDSGDPVKGTVGNTWSSTYNQGTCLGAAVMLYEHYGKEQYRTDADAIMDWTARNLANSHGIIKVCQTVTGDLTGFKGILMRYVRRYAASLGHPEWYSWLARNGYHAWNNRNSKGISMSAWLTKTTENFQYSDGGNFNTDGVGAFTAVSAAFNAHLGVVDERDAYSPMQANEFNFMRGVSVVATGNDDDGTGAVDNMRKGHYVGYRNVDFGTRYASHIIVRGRLPRATSALSVYLDAPSATGGTLVCTIKPLDDADRDGWVTFERALEVPVTGRHDVYVVCSGSAGIDLAAINWFQFAARNTIYHGVASPQGTFSTSMDDSGHTLGLLTDGNPTTQFTGVTRDGGEAWLQYDAPAPVRLQGYSLFAGFDAEADPVGWTLLGSNDGQAWDTLHEVDGATFPARAQRVKCDLAAGAAYTHFRLQLQGKDGQTAFYLSEWQLMGRSLSTADITGDGGDIDTCGPIIDHQGLTPVTLPEAGVVYRAAGNYVLDHYTLTTSSASAPTAWVLEGSNNGTSWKTVDERRDIEFPYPVTTATFLVRDAEPYVWYRLRVTDDAGSELTQWQLFGNIDMGTFYPDATTLMQVHAPDGSSQPALVDDRAETFSTITGDSLYWLLESPIAVRPIAYSLIAAGNRGQTPTAVSVRGLAEDGMPSVLSSRSLTLNARGSRYTSTMATSKSFNRFQLLVTRTEAEGGKATSLTGFELYGSVIAQPGTAYMRDPQEVSASAEGTGTSTVVGKLNDQNRLTGYLADFSDTLTITFSYAAPVGIDAYSLTAGKDKQNCDPTDWVLQGSSDGTDWVTLEKREGECFSHRYATQFYHLPAQATYAHYRLQVTGVNGGTQLQLAELQMLSLGQGTSVLPSRETLAGACMLVSAGQVHVEAPKGGTLCVYDQQGRMLQASRVQPGGSVLPLPGGRGVVVVVLRMQGGTLVRKVHM